MKRRAQVCKRLPNARTNVWDSSHVAKAALRPRWKAERAHVSATVAMSLAVSSEKSLGWWGGTHVRHVRCEQDRHAIHTHIRPQMHTCPPKSSMTPCMSSLACLSWYPMGCVSCAGGSPRRSSA